MQTRHLLSLATLAVTTAAFAADNTFDRTLSTSGSPTVNLATGSGYIHLRAGSDAQVHIAGHIHGNNGSSWFGGGSGGDLQSRIQDIVNHPPIQQNGDSIQIGERHAGDKYRNITIDYDVTLPRGAKVEASTGSGDIETEDVGSTLSADSGSGSVRARAVHGPATLRTGSGDIELEENAQGEVRAHTGSGSIRIREMNGALYAQTGSGDIEANGKITGESRLETGSGSVRLTIGNGAGYTLDATTGSGTIHTQSPIQMSGNINSHHVNGTVNGGGPTLRIVTGSGDVEIR